MEEAKKLLEAYVIIVVGGSDVDPSLLAM